MKTILTGFVIILATLASAESLDDGLVAHFEFEGNGNDSSGNGNHLILSGNPVFTDGVEGNAIAFDGKDDSAIVDKNLVSSLPFTFSCWIRFDPDKVFQDDPPVLLVIMEQTNFWGSNPALYVRLQPEGNTCRFEFFSDFSSHDTVVSQEFTIDSNAWYHLAGVAQSNGDRQIYVNGVSHGIVSNPEFGWIYHQFTMGGAYDFLPQQYMIDEVRIYNRALNGPEIQILYEGKKMWGTYEIQSDNWVNTEDWLGWLQVEHAPWIWIATHQRYFYIPEPPTDSSGVWIWNRKNESG